MKKKKRKFEFSQVFGVGLTLAAVGIGIWILNTHFALMELAINAGTGVAPDAGIAVAAITAMIVPNLAYEAYQGFLKNSRNKHGVDKDGNPHSKKKNDEEV